MNLNKTTKAELIQLLDESHALLDDANREIVEREKEIEFLRDFQWRIANNPFTATAVSIGRRIGSPRILKE